VQKASAVQGAEIATAHLALVPAVRFPHVAEERVAGDGDLASVTVHFKMRQRLSSGAGSISLRGVKAHHRGALRQSITFVNGQAIIPRPQNLTGGYPRPTDSNELKACRRLPALFTGADQGTEQLRDKDQAVGLVLIDRAGQCADIER